MERWEGWPAIRGVEVHTGAVPVEPAVITELPNEYVPAVEAT